MGWLFDSPAALDTRKILMRIMTRIVLVALFASVAVGQNSAPAQPPTAQAIIAFLNQSIRWYRQAVDTPAPTDPEDALTAGKNRQLARDYRKLAFEYARAQAASLESGKSAEPTTDAAAEPASRTRNFQQWVTQATADLSQSQQDLAQVERQLDSAADKKRQVLEAQRSELNSEIALAKARLEIIQTLMNFQQSLGTSGGANGSLASQIDELAKSIPEMQSTATTSEADTAKSNPAASPAPAPARSEPEEHGLLAAINSLVALNRELATTNEQLELTRDLRKSSRSLIAPMTAQLKDTIQRGQSISSGTQATDPVVLRQQKTELYALTQSFKRLSAVVMPIARSGLVLETYAANLTDSQQRLRARASVQLRYVIVHLAVLAAMIGFILLLSAAWRRATLKYVVDVRRQNQILLVRRIAVAGTIAFVLAMALIAEVGALATYAGLVTAGLAVALQNIILSVIAYFFLIGRYGVRMGDRITIAGITGKVAEIGLLRFHLLELKGEETDLHLSGRIVVFSNAVILQPTSHFFKQAPTTDFLWHEMKLTCDPTSDYWLLERKVRAVVERVYDEFDAGRPDRQTLPKPVVKVTVGQNGIIIIVRYAVYAQSTGELDEQVTRKVLSIVYATRGVEVSQPETPREAAIKEG
jgi:small-conductance mechanosensitive channel